MKNCAECGKQFQPIDVRQILCSDICRNKRWKTPVYVLDMSKAGKVCDCGNPATIQRPGRREYICERCDKLERGYATTCKLSRIKRPSVSRIDWPCFGAASLAINF